MYTLEWDKEKERIYETGVRNGVLYTKGSNGYEAGVAWNGLISVSESPDGAESNPIYANDGKYVDMRSKEEFGATITAYTYPDKFAKCDGSASITDGVYIGQQTRLPFGLSYRTVVGNDVEFDDFAYKLHFIYNAVAAPSEKEYQTINDSPEAIEFSWEMTTTPVETGIPGTKPTAILTIDTSKIKPAKKKNIEALESLIYGTKKTTMITELKKIAILGITDTTEIKPTLPTPAQIKAVMEATIA